MVTILPVAPLVSQLSRSGRTCRSGSSHVSLFLFPVCSLGNFEGTEPVRRVKTCLTGCWGVECQLSWVRGDHAHVLAWDTSQAERSTTDTGQAGSGTMMSQCHHQSSITPHYVPTVSTDHSHCSRLISESQICSVSTGLLKSADVATGALSCDPWPML